jgi:outer membrane protein assembly factor BamB
MRELVKRPSPAARGSWPRARPALLVLAALASSAPGLRAQWTQWGGPHRNFTVEGAALALRWPAGGPPEIWSRPFGDGYSAVLVEGDRVYSMRRDGQADLVVCLDAATGRAVWETRYDSPIEPDMDVELGPGPISTPLVAGDRLFTVSSTVRLHALDKKSGAIHWARDLRKELQAPHLGRGYGASPLAWRDLLILTLGGPDRAVAAFRQDTGETVWKSQSFKGSYSSPILIRVGGEEQLVVAMGADRAGLDPATGALRWRITLPDSAEIPMSTPNWGEDGLLFTSTAYGDGTRLFRIAKSGAAFEATQLWYTRHMRVMFGSVVRIGDAVYGSSGDFGPAFVAAVDLPTGRVLWRKRGFGRAHLVRAGEHLLILDEEGDLAVASVSREDLTVHSRANVIGRLVWTPPTLVGTRLYLRNRSTMKALELGAAASASGGAR